MSTADDSEAAAMAEGAEPPSLWTTASPAEAIQLALAQSKLFLVWIPPSAEESSVAWDPVWADAAVHSFLSQFAVAITLAQDSADAAMFLQLVRSVPSAVGVWIVFAGRLLDSFAEPPSPQEMLLRIQNALSSSQAPSAPPPDSLPSQGHQTQSMSQPVASASDLSRQSAPSSSRPSAQTESAQPDTVREQLAARRARLEAAKAQQEKDDREGRRAAAARQAATTDPERQKYIAQQAKERAQQRAERAKILQEIENDKEERRRAKAGQQNATPPLDNPATPPQSRTPAPETNGMTTVAIRFPDSRVQRADFEGTGTLADVRKWIDERRDGAPYVLQTTFPTRTFEVSEEHHETLRSIFGKGGQVIMKEMKTYSEAYQPNSPGIVSLASSLLGSVTGSISNALGWNTPPAPPLEQMALPARTPGEAIREARIRNVNYSARERGVSSSGNSEEDERERNWFNGNGLAQEPPPRDDAKRD